MKRFLAIFLVLTMLVGTTPMAWAADGSSYAAGASEGYYGSKLTDSVAIAFYDALEKMDFASGENLPVADPAVIAQAEAYASGNDMLIRSFGAAVDSFRYDHMEYFYVDWDMLSVNVGRKNGAYVVNIGTGRTDSYLVDKTANIGTQVSEFSDALDKIVAQAEEKLSADATIKDKAKAANDVVCDAVTYDFCDDANGNATEASKYIRTAYGALVNGRAVCEGYARLYKAILDRMGVECELVSGYYIDGEAFEPHMWNYVQNEEGRWYAVDVTMNDGHRLQMGGIPTNYEKYFWQTDEVFSVDHFEDGVVSSVQYEMPYPELHKFWLTPTSSGLFKSGYDAYGDKSGLWFSYDGKDAEQLEAEGLYMAFRTATTNTGSVQWSAWQSAKEVERLYQTNGVLSDNGKTYFLMPNISMFAIDVGIFDTPEDKINEIDGHVISAEYSEEAVTSHLLEKMMVENPVHDDKYISPSYVKETEPYNLLQAWMDVTHGTQHVSLTYHDPLRVANGEEFELTWDVSSYNRRDLSLEAVQKYAKVENVEFDGDRTISFDFTPSKMYNHNMIFYDFDVRGLVNIKDDGTDGVPPVDFTIGARYEDDIACCKIFNDGRLYVNSYAQPSIAMNGDLSTTGWTYEDKDENGNVVTKKVSESQRSQMALVVTKPNDSNDLTEAAMSQVGATTTMQSVTYEIDLNICGKIVQIPNGSYMKLNLGIPDGFENLVGKENVKFKLYHFKRNNDGTLNYENPEEIECVFTPYGIIAEVHSFSPYVLVAVDNSKLPAAERDTSKSIALVNNGHGGKVEGNSVVTLKENGSTTYTLIPDEGYGVEYATLNGKDVAIEDHKITLTYDQLENSNTLEVGFVAESVKEAEAAEGIVPVTPGIDDAVDTCTVTFLTEGGSDIADEHLKVGEKVQKPADPTRTGYTFDGWFTDKECTQAYNFESPVNADITLYAKWTENKPSDSGSTTEPSGGSSSSGSSGGGGGSSSSSSSNSSNITVTSPDKEIKVNQSTVEYSIVKDATESVKDNAAVEVIGGQNCAVNISAKEADTTTVSSFDEPLTVSVSVKANALKDVKDTTKLTLAQVTKDEKGNTVLTYVGGNYNKQTGAFTAYVDEPGDYILVEDSNIKKVELQIGKQASAVNGINIMNDVAPIINNSRTMVPLRFVAETLGAKVNWNGETSTVTLIVDGVTMEMTIGKTIDGFDVAPMIYEDRTMVPIRYIAEKLGANVIYVPKTQEIVVVK